MVDLKKMNSKLKITSSFPQIPVWTSSDGCFR